MFDRPTRIATKTMRNMSTPSPTDDAQLLGWLGALASMRPGGDGSDELHIDPHVVAGRSSHTPDRLRGKPLHVDRDLQQTEVVVVPQVNDLADHLRRSHCRAVLRCAGVILQPLHALVAAFPPVSFSPDAALAVPFSSTCPVSASLRLSPGREPNVNNIVSPRPESFNPGRYVDGLPMDAHTMVLLRLPSGLPPIAFPRVPSESCGEHLGR
jgi:hypothetical protein